jgi:hypothetical protein
MKDEVGSGKWETGELKAESGEGKKKETGRRRAEPSGAR